MGETVDLELELKYDNLCSVIFTRRAVEESLPWVSTQEWTSDESSFLDRMTDPGVESLFQKKDKEFEASVFRRDGLLLYLQILQGEALLRIAGDKRKADAAEEYAKSLLPPADEEQRVRLTFWYWATVSGFARRTRRLLAVPRWGGIAENYPKQTRDSLSQLIPDAARGSGQLILWSGPPGCGKTYALRSLLREWRPNFSFHYISDGERFFAHSDYMLSVLLEEDAGREKLLILEDAGEFLLPDARQGMGQGLSRLLNVSDGLIGQGLGSTFIITTNEEIGRLHPAIARPGRCAAQIGFESFSEAEAQAWLGKHGFEGEVPCGELRLADLFAMTRGDRVTSSSRHVGF